MVTGQQARLGLVTGNTPHSERGALAEPRLREMGAPLSAVGASKDQVAGWQGGQRFLLSVAPPVCIRRPPARARGAWEAGRRGSRGAGSLSRALGHSGATAAGRAGARGRSGRARGAGARRSGGSAGPARAR